MTKKKSQSKTAGTRKIAGKTRSRNTTSKQTKTASRPSASKKAAGKKTTTRKKSSSVTKRKTTAAASARKTTAAKKQTEKKAAKKIVKKAAAASSQKKAAVKKTPAKKATAGKAPAKKPTAKKTGTAKKAAAKPAAGKTRARTSAGKKAPSPSSPSTTPAAKRPAKKKVNQAVSTEKPSTHTPAAKPRPIAFSLDEARKIASNRTAAEKEVARKKASAEEAAAAKKNRHSQEPKPAARVLGAASLSDILGRNPHAKSTPVEVQKKEVPKKFLRYYKLLLELREHVLSELDLHTKDTLKRSSKEDSGNLSSYGQHMADAGTDSFDRDFALSLVSTEQEALSEIESAIERIHNGTYGTCEITGKPIAKERLLAVPFARYSVEGQAEYEKNLKRPSQRGGAYLDSGSEGGEFLTEDPDE